MNTGVLPRHQRLVNEYLSLLKAQVLDAISGEYASNAIPTTLQRSYMLLGEAFDWR